MLPFEPHDMTDDWWVMSDFQSVRYPERALISIEATSTLIPRCKSLLRVSVCADGFCVWWILYTRRLCRCAGHECVVAGLPGGAARGGRVRDRGQVARGAARALPDALLRHLLARLRQALQPAHRTLIEQPTTITIHYDCTRTVQIHRTAPFNVHAFTCGHHTHHALTV